MERVLELLADGDWHRYDEIVGDAGRLVPSGRASRRALYHRQCAHASYLARTGKTKTRKMRMPDRDDEEQLVRTGRRIIVGQAVHGAVRRDDIESRGTGTDREIRLKPLASVVVLGPPAERQAS